MILCYSKHSRCHSEECFSRRRISHQISHSEECFSRRRISSLPFVCHCEEVKRPWQSCLYAVILNLFQNLVVQKRDSLQMRLKDDNLTPLFSREQSERRISHQICHSEECFSRRRIHIPVIPGLVRNLYFHCHCKRSAAISRLYAVILNSAKNLCLNNLLCHAELVSASLP